MSDTIISIHILRSLPPHCINRDDNGLPKSAVFGGVQRSRVSSQSQKRAWRLSEEMQTAGAISMRTREAYILFAESLAGKYRHDTEEAWKVVNAFLPLFFSKIADDDRHVATAVMVMAREEIDAVVDGLHDCFEMALSTLNDKDQPTKDSPLPALAKKLTNQFNGWTTALDIALFARMVASNSNLEIAGAVQVGQMISTHAAEPQPDYYTALDDLAENAAMIGTISYTSGTYYQMINIDWDQLSENLAGDDALGKRGVRALLRASALRLPKGRRTTFFGEALPGLMLVEARTSGPSISLANAFESPVAARNGGLLPASAAALARQWEFSHRFIERAGFSALLIGDPFVEKALESRFEGVTRVSDLYSLEAHLFRALGWGE